MNKQSSTLLDFSDLTCNPNCLDMKPPDCSAHLRDTWTRRSSAQGRSRPSRTRRPDREGRLGRWSPDIQIRCYLCWTGTPDRWRGSSRSWKSGRCCRCCCCYKESSRGEPLVVDCWRSVRKIKFEFYVFVCHFLANFRRTSLEKIEKNGQTLNSIYFSCYFLTNFRSTNFENCEK